MRYMILVMVSLGLLLVGCQNQVNNDNILSAPTTTTPDEMIADTVYLGQYGDNYVLVMKNTQDNNLPIDAFLINDNVAGWSIMGGDGSLNSGITILANTYLERIPTAYPEIFSEFTTFVSEDTVLITMKQKKNDRYNTTIKQYTPSTQKMKDLLSIDDIVDIYDIQEGYILAHLGQWYNIDTIPPYDVLAIHQETTQSINLGKVIDVVIHHKSYGDGATYTRLSTSNPTKTCRESCHLGNNDLIFFIDQRETQRFGNGKKIPTSSLSPSPTSALKVPKMVPSFGK